MKVIKILSWILIIVGAAFFLNSKLKLHISFLEIKSVTMSWVYFGAFVVGALGLWLVDRN